jgi:hypothetical protein
MNVSRAPAEGSELTAAISAAMVELYAAFYEHDRTTASAYINHQERRVRLTGRTRESLALDERRLMAEVSAGSVGAFGPLYDRCCIRAYRVAYSICRDDDRAQGAVQEAFLSIWNSRASYRQQRGTVAAWLLTVVRHRAIELERRNGRDAIRRASCEQLQK